MRPVFLFLCPLLALAACSANTPLDGVRLPSLSGAQARSVGRVAPAQVVSPNGEPLSGGPLGAPDCDEQMDRWFDRVDANQDGRIDRAEFLADARAQFARMDLDHDGFITADELTAYRLPTMGGDTTGQKGKSGARGGRQSAPDAAQDGEDPVMAADANLDFQVSLEEFLALAESKFARLAKDGTWSRDTVDMLCHPEPAKD